MASGAELPSFKPIGTRALPGSGSMQTRSARRSIALTPVPDGATPAAVSSVSTSVRASTPAAAFRRRRPVLLASIFVVGFAAGIGGAYLMPAGLPHANDRIRAVEQGSNLATLFTARDRLVAWMARTGRQIAGRRPDPPPGDNALETYRPVAARSADDAVASAAAATSPPLSASSLRAAPAAVEVGFADGMRPDAVAELDPSRTTDREQDRAVRDPRAAAMTIAPTRAQRPPAGPVPEAPSPETAAVAMARANEAMAHRDIITARRFYELAFAGGVPRAATGVGLTYDPIFLKENGVAGLKGDVDAAKRWYAKAIAAGDTQATPRLVKLLDLSSAAH